MTKIESKERAINSSAERIFSFLSDFNNFESLMPSKVSEWTSTKESCYFTISGIANLGMKFFDKTPSSQIKMVNDGKVPFKFNFIIDIKPSETETKSIVKLTFDADLNPMLKVVAVSPLKDFLESLLNHLEEHKF